MKRGLGGRKELAVCNGLALTLGLDLAPLLEHASHTGDEGAVELEVWGWGGVAKCIDQRGLLVELPRLNISRSLHWQNT